MNKLLYILFIFCAINVNAQDYLISFAGTGESSAVSSVKIENLTAATSLTINGDQVLRLTSLITGINTGESGLSSELKIYPNPMAANATIQIYPPDAGNVTVTVYDMTGKPIASIQSYLESNLQEFRLSGINNGFYVISVKGNTYHYSGKLLCIGNSNGNLSIEKVSNNIQEIEEKATKTDSKGTADIVEMDYTDGDRLKFTGISGNYSTVKTDIPASDKTITFNFIACTDGDSNNYPVVEIGTQIWMAENLKTTKYNDGTVIPNVINSTTWSNLTTGAYCDYDDTPSNSELYGRLYNWYVGGSTNSKNVCPTGWHVPSDADCVILENFLIENDFNYDGSTTGNKIAKSLAGTINWVSSIETGAVGNIDYPAYRNKTGFTALPSGGRFDAGTFYYCLGTAFIFWTSDEGVRRSIMTDGNYLYTSTGGLRYGNSIRCIKDN